MGWAKPEVTGDLIVTSHLNLADASALASFTHTGYFLLFRWNFDLPNCDAMNLVNGFRDAGYTGDICVLANLTDECPNDREDCGMWG